MIRTYGATGFGPARLNGGPALLSLGKPAAAFPGRVATDADLMIAVNRQQTRLALPLDASGTSMTVENAAAIGADNLLTIDNEIVQTTGPPVGNVVPISRGFDDTTPATHLASAIVSGFVDAYHHNALVAEVEAIEAALGANLANVPTVAFVISTTYDFAPQTPGGSLTVGNNVINLSPVPAGINGTDQHHYLYIPGGTGTAEAVLITGGTAVSGAASGTLIVNCANTHSGAWTIRSATAGIQEALVSLGASGGRVNVPPGNFDFYAPVRVSGTGYYIQGAGLSATNIRMWDTGSTNAFEFIAAGLGQFNGLSDLSIFGYNGTVPTLMAGGYALWLQNQANFLGRNLVFYAYPNGIRAKDSGYRLFDVELRELKPSTGIGMYIDGGGAFDNLIYHLMSDASAAYRAGIEIVSAGYVAIDRADLVHANYDLLIDPGAGQFVNTIDVIGSYFDTSYVAGIYIAPQGTGMVTRIRFIDCWTASAGTYGVFIAGVGATVVDGISFIGHYAPFNAQQGFLIGGATTRNIEIRDSFVFGNSIAGLGSYDGIAVGDGVNGLKVSNTVSRRYGDAANTQSRGLSIAAGVGEITVVGNDFSENLVGPLLDQSTSTVKIIRDNAGVDDQTPPTVASAATIALPATGATTFFLSGTTTVTGVTGGWKGCMIRILKSDAGPVTVGGGGNVPGVHTLAQNQSITLTFDGTSWY